MMKLSNCSYWLTFVSLWFISIAYFIIGAAVFYLITITEPNVYVDEIFHVSQAIKYCDGNFTDYDPKITTPPGLYLITIIVVVPLSKVSGYNFCTIHGLRCFNFIIAQLIILLLYKILHSQAHHHTNYNKLRIALNLSLFPVLYFYSFFYYTDVVSTFLVLLTYYLYRVDRSHVAGFVGLLSVFLRQTNIVWFGIFVAIKCCESVVNDAANEGRAVSELEKRKPSYILVIAKESLHSLQVSSLHFIGIIMRGTYFFILTVFCFVYFVNINGSIVLGDKSFHEPVIHLPQLFYFFLFTSIFSFPTCLLPFVKLIKNANHLKCIIILLAIFCILVVKMNTMAHIFLLSDNRHYTFYLWQRIFAKSWGRFGIIPLYIISIFSMIENSKHVDFCTKIAFILGLIMCTIPQKLIEFRYFIIPYLLYRIETCQKLSRWQIEVEFIFNIFVNYLTITLFIRKPFLWPDGSIQRFSW